MKAYKSTIRRRQLKHRQPVGPLNEQSKTAHQAIMEAARRLGADGKGKDGVVGFLMAVGRKKPEVLASLIGKVIPLQARIGNLDAAPLRLITSDMDVEEAARAYASTLSQLPGLSEADLEGPAVTLLQD